MNKEKVKEWTEYAKSQAFTIVVITLIVWGLTIPIPHVSAVTTLPAQNISGMGSTNVSVTLVGTDPGTQYCWFELGRQAGIYPWNNSARIHTGKILLNITGFPMFAGQDYHYRYCCYSGCGNDVGFKLNSSKIMPDTTYATEYMDPIIESDWNFTLMSEKAQKVFDVPLGSLSAGGALVLPIFVGGIWMLLLAMLWIRTENITIPLFVSMIMSGYLFGTTFMDAPMVPVEWRLTLALMLMVSMGGLIYFLWKGR